MATKRAGRYTIPTYRLGQLSLRSLLVDTQVTALFNSTVILPPGEYEFVIYDSFGDGICCAFGEGWFSLTNTCGLDTAVYDFLDLSSTSLLRSCPVSFQSLGVQMNHPTTTTPGLQFDNGTAM